MAIRDWLLFLFISESDSPLGHLNDKLGAGSASKAAWNTGPLRPVRVALNMDDPAERMSRLPLLRKLYMENPSRAHEAPSRSGSVRLFLVCLLSFLVLVALLSIWPYTGDADAAFHYRNLRETAANPQAGLSSWARPLYVAMMIVPALGGPFSVKTFSALISAVLMWQTVRMAEDLRMSNSILAGPLVLLQPLAFAMASDTMTEIPMALGIVCAIRLWWSGRFLASSVLVAFLPLVRPEGFFLLPIWGAMLLAGKKPYYVLVLGLGVISWIIACLVIVGEPFYFIRAWSWPLISNESCGRGSPFHYVVNWPRYCGPVLSLLFLFGVVPSVRTTMRLPLSVWLTVIFVHSVLWWRGWCASVGILRILVCTSAITSIICLYGLNFIGGSGWWRMLPLWLRSSALVCAAVAALATSPVYYITDRDNHLPTLMRQAAGFVRSNRLLEDAPAFFVSDEVALEILDFPVQDPQWRRNSYEKDEQRRILAALPIGSVGVWDNQRGKHWFHVEFSDLASMNYVILFDVNHTVPPFGIPFFGRRDWAEFQECVVVKRMP